jgi:SAM-dependent methyltransferase
MTNIKLSDKELNEIYNKWYIEIYDLEENGTDDILLLLSLLGNQSLKVLEAACGTGRILIPIAKAGHQIHGFDLDEYMMSRIPDKAKGLNNLTYGYMDALHSDWGNAYDAVILAGNILLNLESDIPNSEAQQILIQKAADCLKVNGHVFMDFGLFAHPDKVFSKDNGRVIFEGTDSNGISGKYIVIGDSYNAVTQLAAGRRRIELIMPDGHQEVLHQNWQKHIPTLVQVHKWLEKAGLAVELEYGSYDRQPITESTSRSIIYARKVG